MGNIYVFIVAGHGSSLPWSAKPRLNFKIDTTAHTLAFSLALLAIYPEIQEKLFQQISFVLGERTEPVSKSLLRKQPDHTG